MNCSNLLLKVILNLWLFTGCYPGEKTGKADIPEKPNILFIFADDQCYSTIQALGIQKSKLPISTSW